LLIFDEFSTFGSVRIKKRKDENWGALYCLGDFIFYNKRQCFKRGRARVFYLIFSFKENTFEVSEAFIILVSTLDVSDYFLRQFTTFRQLPSIKLKTKPRKYK
jgi:hypothetical protein